jgi:hypothetical protein
MEGDTSRVEALPFLPGLYVHKPPRRRPPPGRYNITHVLSGLAILKDVPEGCLETVRMVTGRVTWDKPAAVIFNDARYMKAVKEAMATLTQAQLDSKAQEEGIASDIGGKPQPASGSQWGLKRDVIAPRVLVEAKTTGNAAYRLPLKDLAHLRVQAYSGGRIPAYVIAVGGLEDVVIMPAQEFSADEFAGVSIDRSDCCEKKSFQVTREMSAAVTGDLGQKNARVIRLITDDHVYMVISYGRFLDKVRTGTE